MSALEFSDEIRTIFYSVYNNNPANLELVAKKLQEKGLGYMEILVLTRTELKIGLGKAIMLLKIPDYTG